MGLQLNSKHWPRRELHSAGVTLGDEGRRRIPLKLLAECPGENTRRAEYELLKRDRCRHDHQQQP